MWSQLLVRWILFWGKLIGKVMAEETRFQAEMTRKMDLVIQKLGGYKEKKGLMN